MNLAVGVIFDNNVYAWLFSVTKFARFSHYEWSSLVSATTFILLMILFIHLAPIGMGIFLRMTAYKEKEHIDIVKLV